MSSPEEITVTHHAALRYGQRTDQGVTLHQAVQTIRELLGAGRASPRPRRWTRLGGYKPGTRFVSSAAHPGVCLIVVDGAVVTVYSRRVCRQWRNSTGPTAQNRRQISPRTPKPRWRWRWRWEGYLAEDGT